MRWYRIFVVGFMVLIMAVTSAYASTARIALVIGNGAYPGVSRDNLFDPLANSRNDADDMATALRAYGFQVDVVKDADQQQMERVVNAFIQRLQAGDVGLFYFSGHGVQVENLNYLIPVGRQFRDAYDIKYHAINANWILEKMLAAKTQVNIMILDACRQNLALEERKGLAGKGFAKMEALGAIISYATMPGSAALGDIKARNSIYTQYLLDAMQQSSLPIERVFKRARAAVAEATDYEQVPWTGDGLIGDFCFGECATPNQRPDVSQLLQACERHFQANRLTTGRGGTALECYEEVLKQDPANVQALTGLNRIEAKYAEWVQQALANGEDAKAQRYLASLRMVNPESSNLRALEAQLPQPKQIQSPLPMPSPEPTSVSKPPVIPSSKGKWTEPITGMTFVWIPGGSFQMGCVSGVDCYSTEKPVHTVSVDSFWMATTEVTNQQYRKWKSDHDSGEYSGKSLNDDNQPVVRVSWEDATAFAEWLTQQYAKNPPLASLNTVDLRIPLVFSVRGEPVEPHNMPFDKLRANGGTEQQRLKSTALPAPLKGGIVFRLPTEAEWEYAARAGTTTARFWDNSPDKACQFANVHDQTSKRLLAELTWTPHHCKDGYSATAPVGKFRPNAFGLYDLLGNVWEWCQDVYSKNAYRAHQPHNPVYTGEGTARVLRGGSWFSFPRDVRCESRFNLAPEERDYSTGFRLVMTNES
jgi:sulfatase modifying factor 1